MRFTDREKISRRWAPAPALGKWRPLCLALVAGCLAACTDFVEARPPGDRPSAGPIFEDSAMAESALNGVYYRMRTSGMLSGDGLSVAMGLYADELDHYPQGGGSALGDYHGHTVGPDDPIAEGFWNGAYAQVYTANAVIEGVGGSAALAQGDRDRFTGEALFARAYLHLLLAGLFGDVPYVTGTDYADNRAVGRMPRAQVYGRAIADLERAEGLLPGGAPPGERIRPSAAAAAAVLARAHLYAEQWALAGAAADRAISAFGPLDPDLEGAFLKDAPGTIWQFAPNARGENTREGAQFIFNAVPPLNIALAGALLDAFEPGDRRRDAWVREVAGAAGTWYHAFKYRQAGSTGASVEYSVQLRLAEMYLVRAEARARTGDLQGARADIDAVRARAGLGGTPALAFDGLLGAILRERRVELFTEQGQRWFDLRRTGRAAGALGPIKPNWRDHHILLPLPRTELELNPNLLPQNPGY
ncbi:RagB/SusD family nutrient uptake outer membrane protein [Flavivirga sp. 57AJ16]|uniref:RagB/SusD family nutrient uptake outer membrane protein n=1 Tax=Flavivirga sp. 57AJ16 TaxID=3025307 RepID=UPI0023661AA0|nr:RagB/SusD family nutrient uptake outer membrane protein [Flavivirga sp. 57AJ16]MDD7888309.1 RagB/SusD family nutrient uptake outer membrane protein [Flavivirga sp. 57AJ16]